MTYYRVKPQFDQCYKNPKVHDGDILIANELYTPAERNKMPHILDKVFDKVEISSRKTYWLFGARFADITDEMREREKLVEQGFKEQARLAFYND